MELLPVRTLREALRAVLKKSGGRGENGAARESTSSLDPR